MVTCMTAVDAMYAVPFPAYDALAEYVLYELPQRNKAIDQTSTMMWWSELGFNNHERLERVFTSKGKPSVVRAVGTEIDAQGGKQAMVAMFYVYLHFVAGRAFDLGLTPEQVRDAVARMTTPLELAWDGIGEWMA